MKSRRQFLRTAGTGILAAGLSPMYASEGYKAQAGKPTSSFSIGMAGYSFKEFTVEKTIEMMNRIGVKNLSLKDFHMPMNSSQEQVDEVLAKFKNAGITVYTLGVIYMKTTDTVDLAFEYAKKAGVSIIVAAPNYELLPYVEKKIKEYDFRMAIHNHGPDNPLYPNATDIWNHIKNLDLRIGICMDIGHTKRDGQDPSEDLEKYHKRVYDVHIKDVDKPTKEGKTVEIGRGIIDIPKFVSTLRKVKYTGVCSLEFEKDMKDPLAGIAESIGYFKGVLDAAKS